MRKRIQYLFILGAVAVTACNRQLDLAPEDTLVDREVFKSEAGSEQALAEAYYNLQEAVTSNIAYTIGDFTTPNLHHTPFYDAYTLGETTPADDGVLAVWTNYFKAINTANNVMLKVQQYGNFDEAKEQQFIAEAAFIRAYAYLDLLKLFGEGALTNQLDGPGLPLQLTPFEGYNTGDVILRSTCGKVYEQIVKDLEDHMAALPETHGNELKTRSRATRGGAAALLARTLLYMRRYEDAADAAKLVLDKTPALYALTPNLMQLFPRNENGSAQNLTPEYLLAFPVSHMVSSSTSANNHLGGTYFFKRSFWVNKQFLDAFEPGDLRASQLIFQGDSIHNFEMLNELTTFKFNNSLGRDNVPAIRLAEVILIRAEALARTQGVDAEAVALLNDVRNRSVPAATPYTTNDFASQDELVTTILQQRRFELAFEGFYRYDLIRTGQPLRQPDIPENKKVLPIPQIEIDISNGVLVQNTGYK